MVCSRTDGKSISLRPSFRFGPLLDRCGAGLPREQELGQVTLHCLITTIRSGDAIEELCA
jgi:hypothetical protein